MERYDKNSIKLPKKLYDQIENDVVNLYLELELTVPIDPKEIATRLGYVVRKMSDIKEIDRQKMLRFDKEGNRRDGYSYYDPFISTFVIWVNDLDTLSFEHDDFTIMHEIGHIRLGHKEESDLANRIANYYAAYALVPSPLYALLRCKNATDIINTFGVSDKCAENCYPRCINWMQYNGFRKQFEIRLRTYYENVLAEKKKITRKEAIPMDTL